MLSAAFVDQSASGERGHFYPEQVRQLYSFLPVGLIATAVNSAIVLAVLWPVLRHPSLVIWFGALLALTSVRILVLRRYNGTDEHRKKQRYWGRLLIGGNVLSGALWGLLPIFLFPAESMPHQVFQAFVIGGMVAGSVGIYSTLRLAFAAYALPAFVPVTVRFCTFSDGLHLAMAALCSIFMVLMFMSSFRNHAAHRAVLELNVENQSLIRRLSEKSTKAEQIAEELRNLTAYLHDVREEESKRIASEIHDQLGQSLTAAKMTVARLRKSPENLPAGLREGLESLSELLGTVLGDVRRISRHLRPLVLDEFGLEAAVEWLVTDFRETTGVICDLQSGISTGSLGSDISVTLFRILQEALTNVARHAEARHVRIILIEREGEVQLRVEDDGRGIPADYLRPHTFGVLNMKERALRLRGEVLISPAEPTGTIVSVRIPTNAR